MISDLPIAEGFDTKFFSFGKDCLAELVDAAARTNTEGRRIVLVFDENTYEAAGERVEGLFRGRGVAVERVLLEPEDGPAVNATYAKSANMGEFIRTERLFPVAVGSGTINDLVKRAAFEAGTPYLCVPTAASIDGYCSFGASLVKDGYKETFPCTPPLGVFADTSVLVSAPYAMTASGYGDLYSKLTAGLDWILADRLGIEPIRKEAWDLAQKGLGSRLESPRRLKQGDPEAFERLFLGLSLSGLAMQVYEDSRPASGAEHMVSHVWEMEHLTAGGRPVSHGFKVAVGTVLIAGLMEKFFFSPLSGADIASALRGRQSWEERVESIERCFPQERMRAKITEVCRSKWADDAELERRLVVLAQTLPELGHIFKETLGSAAKVASDLNEAGCPTRAADLGLSDEELGSAVVKAQMIRGRYTVLDALYEAGVLPVILESVKAERAGA